MNKFRQAPLELKIFIFFSIFVSIIAIVLPKVSREIYEKIIPYTGWTIASAYNNVLIFCLLYIFQKTRINLAIFKFSTIILFSISMYHGYQAMTIGNGEDFNNPYLIVSEYRYIWVFVIPIAWILVFLLSPNLKFRESK